MLVALGAAPAPWRRMRNFSPDFVSVNSFGASLLICPAPLGSSGNGTSLVSEVIKMDSVRRLETQADGCGSLFVLADNGDGFDRCHVALATRAMISEKNFTGNGPRRAASRFSAR